jgi:membrane-associated protein
MLAVGMLLGPLTGGNPLLSLVAGIVMAIVTAAGFAVVQRMRTRRAAARAAAAALAPAG